MSATDDSLRLYIQACNLRELLKTKTVKIVNDVQFRNEMLARTHVFLAQMLTLSFLGEQTRRRIEEFIATEKLVMRATEFDARQHIGSLVLLVVHLEEVLASHINANK